MTTLLALTNISTAYDQVNVLHGVSLDAKEGEITCILGANGAGKSTLIRSILGLTPPNQGQIEFAGASLIGLPTHKIISHGISCIPEGRKVFPKMTIDENLRVGGYQVSSEAVLRRRLAEVYETFPRLKERISQLAGTLSGGEQSMLSIGRGLMSKPKMLILDEPSLGLSPLLVQEEFRIIGDINRSGVTILLVDQNARQTLAISNYGYVLSQGRLEASGSAQELSENPQVQAAYFG